MSSNSEVLCIGETMVLLTSSTGQSLEKSDQLDIHVAGAESNVAAGMTHLGQAVSWFGRVGNDPWGRRVRQTLAGHGIDVSLCEEDTGRPTGLYFKEVTPSGTSVHYYRCGSAASAMSKHHISSLNLETRRLCHFSGITPALSRTCDEMLSEITGLEPGSRPILSFDVNYRPGLWDREIAATRLFELAAASDIVIVGRDEAQSLWDTGDPSTVRALFPEVPQLVVKDNDIGATAYVGRKSYFVPALEVEVVEAVGAGDAFAAGYLTGLLTDLPVRERLRLGHLMASYVLTHVGDLPHWPEKRDLIRMSEGDESRWEELRSSLLSVNPSLPGEEQ